jgi:6-phospho-3-hexuloisomerase
MVKNKVQIILKEIKTVLQKLDEEQVDQLISSILNANKIVVCGAGRVGMVTKAFGQRLAHLGLKAYTVGDSNIPFIGRGDLLIASSGSGETQTIFDLVTKAKESNASVALITGNPQSRMGKLANTVVKISAPSKTKSIKGFISAQPMTTLNEQSLWIFYDALILLLMEKVGQTHDDMWSRHSILE